VFFNEPQKNARRVVYICSPESRSPFSVSFRAFGG
jgi:hypothetical protein